MDQNIISVNKPVVSNDSVKFVNDALDSVWISSSGKFVQEFEDNFSTYLDMKYAVAVSSGTTALHTALLSMGVGKGDEIIVPAFTMAATWMAVLYTGAVPVFVDCELDTYNIDVEQIEKKISKKTKAIIPVHIYGHPVEIDKIKKIAKKHNLIIIEDAAEAHGAEYKSKKCGSFGDINCFSFYANKLIATGEGGMVVTNNEEFATRARKYRDLYHSDKKRFIHEKIGYNYRMTNLQAAIGCGELMHIDEYILKKEYIASLYGLLLSDVPGIRLPKTKENVRNVYWMYAILVDEEKFGIGKNELREKLQVNGIETRDFFYPPSEQPVLKKYLNQKDKFPNTQYISERGMYLPSGLSLTDAEIKTVAEAIKKTYSSLH